MVLLFQKEMSQHRSDKHDRDVQRIVNQRKEYGHTEKHKKINF